MNWNSGCFVGYWHPKNLYFYFWILGQMSWPSSSKDKKQQNIYQMQHFQNNRFVPYKQYRNDREMQWVKSLLWGSNCNNTMAHKFRQDAARVMYDTLMGHWGQLEPQSTQYLGHQSSVKVTKYNRNAFFSQFVYQFVSELHKV